MTPIARATAAPDIAEMTAILREYLTWNLAEMRRVGGPAFDPDALAARTLDNLPAYLPPKGHLLTARGEDGALLAVGFLKRIRPDTAEIKRLYVRPEARGTGLGRQLADELIGIARQMNCAHVLIDTGTYMTQALALYRSLGFREIAPYPESENDASFAPFLVYMQLDL